MIVNKKLEQHIRCKCGQKWGMPYYKEYHKRCKTEVIARGELGNKR